MTIAATQTQDINKSDAVVQWPACVHNPVRTISTQLNMTLSLTNEYRRKATHKESQALTDTKNKAFSSF